MFDERKEMDLELEHFTSFLDLKMKTFVKATFDKW